MDTHQWIEFGPDGSETTRTGDLWAPAPRHRGGDSVWVRQHHDGAMVRIAAVARAHYVGIRPVAGGKWAPAGGRMVTKGEWYREVDPASRMALDTEALAQKARDRWRRARRPAQPLFDEEHWIKCVNRQAEKSEQ